MKVYAFIEKAKDSIRKENLLWYLTIKQFNIVLL